MDPVKAQKVAAARKKLKEYQKNLSSKKPVKKVEEENVTPVDHISMTSSTHSDVQECTLKRESEISPISVSNLHLDQNSGANYFNTSLFQTHADVASNHVSTNNYFDNLSTDNTNILDAAFAKNDSNLDNFTVPSLEPLQNTSNIEYADPFGDVRETLQPIQAEISLQPIQAEIEKQQNENNSEFLDVPFVEKANSESHSALMEPQTNVSSNTENLRQLSSQLNSLLESEEIVAGNGDSGVVCTSLERRNQELAAALATETLRSEQLELQVHEYVQRVEQLEGEVKAVRTTELAALQEQVQCHVQAVGVLVAERTELEAAVQRAQAETRERTLENEELQGRLKASRHRVADLEREIQAARNNRQNNQQNGRELEQLMREHQELRAQHIQSTEEAAELREKLDVKVNECSSLQRQVQDIRSQLSLTELRVQQLSDGDNGDSRSEIQQLEAARTLLEQQVAELSESLRASHAEREQANQQYQQYVQQLNGQIHQLAEKLEQVSTESDSLAKREQSLVKHIGDLEIQLQQQKQPVVAQVVEPVVQQEVVKELEERIEKLVSEKTELEEKYAEEIQAMEERMQELETEITRLQKEQPDASKLLAAIESDKVAASRAVEQNNKLKSQLDELHQAFIQMSNNKLELTEKLQAEQHQNRELTEKVTTETAAIEHLHEVIAAKDKEITELNKQIDELITEKDREIVELNKQILQQNQLTDRLRHYEVQGNTSELVQQDLQQARHTINQLNEQIKQYQQTERERINHLAEDSHQTTQDHEDLQQTQDATNHSEFSSKERAMEQLEERFKKTMLEVADLTEEKQRLEHLVMQLQSETETIGEYVALYQCQRAILKEKTLEKDEQLRRLSHDREEVKIKLDELNALIEKLMASGGNTDAFHKLAHNTESNKKSNEKINGSHVHDNNNGDTAGKIIALLSEIKTSNLVQPADMNFQNFHPCPWCQGQLITV